MTRENAPLPRLSSRRESQPPPFRGTSFHGKEGECRLADSPYRWLSIRKCCFPAFVISSESETSFSFAVKKECERSGQWETLCSLCLGRTVFHANRSTREREHGKRKRSLGCARDDDTRMTLSRTTFSPLREPTSAPLGHLLPWEGGRMPPHRLPIQMAFDTKMPLPRIRHFEQIGRASCRERV